MQTSSIIKEKYTTAFESFKKELQAPLGTTNENNPFDFGEIVKNLISKENETSTPMLLRKIVHLEQNLQLDVCRIVQFATASEKAFFKQLYKQIESNYENKDGAVFDCMERLILTQQGRLQEVVRQSCVAVKRAKKIIENIAKQAPDITKSVLPDHVNHENLEKYIGAQTIKNLDDLLEEYKSQANAPAIGSMVLQAKQSLSDYRFYSHLILDTADKCGMDSSFVTTTGEEKTFRSATRQQLNDYFSDAHLDSILDAGKRLVPNSPDKKTDE